MGKGNLASKEGKVDKMEKYYMINRIINCSIKIQEGKDGL
jgi:hypothetical protein